MKGRYFLNIDENVKRIVTALLKKWQLLIIFMVIGAIAAYAYTANFTTLTYNSEIEFLAYVVDSNQELADSNTSSSTATGSSQQRISETSKMNYAMKMLDTYIEVFSTNAFNQTVADTINKKHGTDVSAETVKNAIKIQKVENTAMFTCSVTTFDADLSYNIALALADCVPRSMEKTNEGLVLASVEDEPLKASTAISLGYPKKCLIGAMAGFVLAAAYIILRDLLDVRIKTEEELSERYNIPVLGSIPAFESKNKESKANKKERNNNG